MPFMSTILSRVSLVGRLTFGTTTHRWITKSICLCRCCRAQATCRQLFHHISRSRCARPGSYTYWRVCGAVKPCLCSTSAPVVVDVCLVAETSLKYHRVAIYSHSIITSTKLPRKRRIPLTGRTTCRTLALGRSICLVGVSNSRL